MNGCYWAIYRPKSIGNNEENEMIIALGKSKPNIYD